MRPSALDQVQRIGLHRNNQQWRFSKYSPLAGGQQVSGKQQRAREGACSVGGEPEQGEEQSILSAPGSLPPREGCRHPRINKALYL